MFKFFKYQRHVSLCETPESASALPVIPASMPSALSLHALMQSWASPSQGPAGFGPEELQIGLGPEQLLCVHLAGCAGILRSLSLGHAISNHMVRL